MSGLCVESVAALFQSNHYVDKTDFNTEIQFVANSGSGQRRQLYMMKVPFFQTS